MNTENKTVVTSELLKQMRELGLDHKYEPVPDDLRSKADSLLKGRSIADMDDDMKRKVRNIEERLRKSGVPGY